MRKWTWMTAAIGASILLFVCLPEPWNYLLVFNAFLLLASLIWYEVPAAKKIGK